MAYSAAQKKAYFARKNAEAKKPKPVFVPLAAPSIHQKRIFDFIANPNSGSLVVSAVAGSGKTTTILNALTFFPRGRRICFCAFNSDIVKELTLRCPVEGIKIATTHSLGFAAVKRRFGLSHHDIDKDKLIKKIWILLGLSELSSEEEIDEESEMIDALKKATAFAKNTLSLDENSVSDMIEKYDLDYGQVGMKDEAKIEATRNTFIANILLLLKMCKEDTSCIDFDDMLYFVVAYNLPMEQFDDVCVDETQDLNKCQMSVIKKMLLPGARILAFGDERQAIYVFRAADENSMSDLINTFKATQLPLSISYRCAKAIVNYTKEKITGLEHLESSPTAPEGEVHQVDVDQMLEAVKPGDFIISRLNAPMIGIAIKLLNNNIPCNIRGKDLGNYFKYFIKRSGKKSIPDFIDYLVEWQETQLKNLVERKRKPVNMDAIVDSIRDKVDCMTRLASECLSMKDMTDKITKLFVDKGDNKRVWISTTHKAKGLESDRCFVLQDTYRNGQSTEESNLFYVACTRAKTNLYIVEGKPKE